MEFGAAQPLPHLTRSAWSFVRVIPVGPAGRGSVRLGTRQEHVGRGLRASPPSMCCATMQRMQLLLLDADRA